MDIETETCSLELDLGRLPKEKALKVFPGPRSVMSSYFGRITGTFLKGAAQPRESLAIISPDCTQSSFASRSSTQLPGLSSSSLGTDGFLPSRSKPFFNYLTHFNSLFPADISQIDDEPWQQGCAGVQQQQHRSQTRCPCTPHLQLGPPQVGPAAGTGKENLTYGLGSRYKLHFSSIFAPWQDLQTDAKPTGQLKISHTSHYGDVDTI